MFKTFLANETVSITGFVKGGIPIKDSSLLIKPKSNSELWSKIAKEKGGQYAIWSNLPINPNLN